MWLVAANRFRSSVTFPLSFCELCAPHVVCTSEHLQLQDCVLQRRHHNMSDTTAEGIAFAARILTTSHLAATLAVIALVSVLTQCLHRLYFHPLKSHPGPLFARLTPLPDLYHAYRGDKHIHFLHVHAKYGPVVRFAPNSLSINDPAALRAIYGHGANVQKSEAFYHAFRAHPAAISTLLANEPG